MKLLVIGGGGREHALAWKFAASPGVSTVYVAPGNAGTASEPGVCNVDIGVMDVDSLLSFARDSDIGLTVVGPEAPLVAGIVDRFREAGLDCLGPTMAAARLEGSKSFAKDFMGRHDIPTAGYRTCSDPGEAIGALGEFGLPVVIKADGLAAGKGVIVARDRATAESAILDMLSGNRFGDAGHRVVIESFLAGEEASFICLVDGSHVLPMASSQDHKAACDGDQGPNTGGMGAYSPAPIVDDAMTQTIMDRVIHPLVKGMAAEGSPYTGFLYAGLMIGDDGVPNVVEFNCRFGDPEAQPVLTRLRSDLAGHCIAAVNGELDGETAHWDSRPCLGVVMAAAGYPGDYHKGDVISGLDAIPREARVFHAGTAIHEGAVVTSGGRVLCVTAQGESVLQAQQRAYTGVDSIHWNGAWCRRDIGFRAVARETR
jgi:phosphoribosylamine--glycine ligase